MALQWDTGGGGWYDPATGRSYSRADERAAQPYINSVLQGMGGGNPFGMPAPPIAPSTTTTAPRYGQAGFVGSPGDMMEAPINVNSGQRAPTTVYEPYYHNQQQGGGSPNGGSIATGGPGAAYGNQAGASATTGAAPQVVSPQQLVWQRAMQEAQDRQARLSMQKWFNVMPKQQPGFNSDRGVMGAALGSGLEDTFNSASGPYGQMQAAAVMTAPSRASQAIASMETQAQERIAAQNNATKAQIAKAIAGAISNGPGSQLGEMSNDFQRYSPMFDPRLRRVQPRPVFGGQ